MSRRLKGFRGLHFSLTRMHKSTSIFMGLTLGAQQAWSAFDRKNSLRRMKGERVGSGGGRSLL